MKTKRFLFIVALLVASASINAESSDVVVDHSVSIKQTEELVKQFNLNKKQAKKILTINQKYLLKNTLLVAQRYELERLGFMDETVMGIYTETVSKFENEKKEALKSIVNTDQWIAFEGDHSAMN
jgi:hypothetical protein